MLITKTTFWPMSTSGPHSYVVRSTPENPNGVGVEHFDARLVPDAWDRCCARARELQREADEQARLEARKRAIDAREAQRRRAVAHA